MVAGDAKSKISFSKWAAQPRPRTVYGFELRRKLSEAMNKFIHDNGGWVTSHKVALLAFDLLACIIAMRIDPRPPFSALLTL
jgi:hypothetical protein